MKTARHARILTLIALIFGAMLLFAGCNRSPAPDRDLADSGDASTLPDAVDSGSVTPPDTLPDGENGDNGDNGENPDEGDDPAPAHSHAWSDWATSVAPTCTQDGQSTRTCPECGEQEDQVLPATGHTEATLPGKASTCQATGLTDGIECSACHTVLLAQTETPKSGHSYTDDACTVCYSIKKTSEGLAYSLNDDETAYTVTGIGSCTDTEVVIPALYNGKPVTAIDGYAFSGGTFTAISLSSRIESIGSNIFGICTELVSITVDSGNPVLHASGNCLIETASKTLIAGCKASIIPSDGSVKIIGDYAFYFCEDLTSIVIPDSVTEIGSFSFFLSGLTSVKFPDSVTMIGEYAFGTCLSLAEIQFGSGLQTIGESAFSSCTAMTEIHIPDSLTELSPFVFSYCSGLVALDIPTSVEIIGDYAFYQCSALERVTGGTSVTRIGEFAFFFCKSLKSFSVSDTVVEIGASAFARCSVMTSVTFGKSLTSVGNSAFSYCTLLKTVEFESNLTSIGEKAFMGCAALETVSLPESITSVGSSAFASCGAIRYAVYDNANYLGNDITPYLVLISATDTAITDCKINESTRLIADYAFSRCSALTAITLPDSVRILGAYAFSGCTSLKDLTLSGDLITVGDAAFHQCSALTAITVPKNVTSIGSNAFGYCSGIASLTVESGNPVYHGVGNCIIDTRNKTLVAGCKNSVIPTDGSVTAIGSGAFYGCADLKQISIPGTVVSIGMNAFADCTGLTELLIPESVKQIDTLAFNGCSNLSSVTFAATTGWSASRPGSTTAPTDISLPDSATAAKYLTSTYARYTWMR